MSDTSDTERLLDELWPTRPPPAGFADRVLDAARSGDQAAPRSGRRRRTWPLRLGAGGAAAAGLALALWGVFGGAGGGVHDAGHLRAQERSTVNIGSRAVAVAEAGAEIAWARKGGRLRIDQPRGTVFYRVDRGGSFQVVTPAGEVEVTGTCFRVTSDIPDGRRLAALVTAAWVEVMEGSVVVRNGQGELALAAGERARLALGSAPSRQPWRADPPDSVAALPSGRAPYVPAGPVTAVASTPELAGAGPRSEPADDFGLKGKYFDFTPKQRQLLARRCNFRWTLPQHLTHFAGLDFKELSLHPEQRSAITRILEQHRQEFLTELRAIYVEVVGDRVSAERLTAMSLFQEADAKSPREEGVEARQLILREWAGEVAAPADRTRRPAIERMWRLLVGAQDDIVRRLEQVVSGDDARRIGRAIQGIRVNGTEAGCPTLAKSEPAKP